MPAPTALELLSAILACQQEQLAELRKLTARKESTRAVRRVIQSGTFSEFWDLYPRRVGKMAAERAYSHALGVDTHAAIIAGLARFKDWLKRNNVPDDKTPHPATWLNAGRWMDEDARRFSTPPKVQPIDDQKESSADEAKRKAREWTEQKWASLTPGEQLRISGEVAQKFPMATGFSLKALIHAHVRRQYSCPIAC